MSESTTQLKNGLKDGLPIALGYLPVSFSFGMLATAGGIPPWVAIAISMTNLTSAGQFAGMNLIIENSTYLELAISMFVINIRYMLMSLALSQKIENMSLLKRMILSIGITDEVFAVSFTKLKKISFVYMISLILFPYIGWSLGTILGALAAKALPAVIASSMGITLYAMFLAIILPASRNNKSILIVVLIAALISCLLYYTPILNNLSSGWAMIIAAVIASAIGAFVFNQEE